MNEELINYIKAYIKDNNNQEITGDVLQATLLKIVSDLKSDIFTINANFSLVELDNYVPQIKQGMYKVMSIDNTLFYGLLLVYPIMAGGQGYQVFIGSKIYNVEAGNIQNPTIIWRSFNSGWGEWKLLQSLFVSDNGNRPSSELEKTQYAPSMRLFEEKTGYKKIAYWSGRIEETAEVKAQSVVGTDQTKIVFVKSANTFAYGSDGNYSNNWTNRADFQENIYTGVDFTPNFTQNFFKAGIGIYIATSSNKIEQLI